MPKWDPSSEWEGEDAYIVGGGPSLAHFNWGLIRGKNTIGCNSAYILGVDIVKIVIFADYLWWKKIGEKGTEKYGGRVVGCSDRLKTETCPWLLTMDRHPTAVLSSGRTLSYAGNTGSLALNLALILGARRVFLLGFDMKLGAEKKPNWHTLRYEGSSPEVYHRFVNEFRWVADSFPKVFPGREIWNVTDDSDLPYFPKVSPAVHFAGERVGS